MFTLSVRVQEEKKVISRLFFSKETLKGLYNTLYYGTLGKGIHQLPDVWNVNKT